MAIRNVSKLLTAGLISFVIFAGCSDDGKQSTSNETKTESNNPNTNETSKKDTETSAAYKEVESFDIDGKIAGQIFSIDEKGEIISWGEKDKKLSDEQRKFVRIIGDETITLDKDEFKIGTEILPDGTLITDRSENKEDKYLFYIFDPKTGEDVEKNLPKEAHEYVYPLLLPNPKIMNIDENLYIHTITNVKKEMETFLWNYETDEITDLSIIKDIVEKNGKDIDYPRLQLSKDGKTIYAIVPNNGIYQYDIESQTLEQLFEHDNLSIPITTTAFITRDERYIPYIDETTDDREHIGKLFDVETKESIDLGIFERIFNKTDGNIMILKDNKLYDYDTSTQEEQLAHTFELGDRDRIKNIDVSADGSTIFVVIEYHEENDDGDKEYVQKAHVLKR